MGLQEKEEEVDTAIRLDEPVTSDALIKLGQVKKSSSKTGMQGPKKKKKGAKRAKILTVTRLYVYVLCFCGRCRTEAWGFHTAITVLHIWIASTIWASVGCTRYSSRA